MIEQFFTREKAEMGKEIPLSYPDGSVSEYSLFIRGIDSDHFKKAERESLRQAVELREKKNKEQLTDEEMEAFLEDKRLELVASLVIRWTLPDEFNHENLMQLLREAPQIAEEVNRKAADRQLFFRRESDSSKNTPDGSTDSKNHRPDQSKA